MSALPAGFGFQFELQLDNSVVPGSTPIMDRVEMSFNPSNFQRLSNTLGIPADENGDYNANGIPNLIEFATGLNFVPQLQEDGTITIPTTSGAIDDGYRLELQYSTDLVDWKPATTTSDGARIVSSNNLANGNLETVYQIEAPDGEGQIFWRIAAF